MLDEYNPASNKDYSAKFFILNLECLKKWSEEYRTSATDLTEDSGFVKKYEKLLKNGVSFPMTATVTNTLFEQGSGSKKPGLEKPVLEPPKPVQVASMFTERQQKTPLQVKKLLSQEREDIVKYIMSRDETTVDYEELSAKLDAVKSTFRENRATIGDLYSQDPDTVDNERSFMMELATALSQAEEGDISFKDLQKNVVKFCRSVGWLDQDGRGLLMQVALRKVGKRGRKDPDTLMVHYSL